MAYCPISRAKKLFLAPDSRGPNTIMYTSCDYAIKLSHDYVNLVLFSRQPFRSFKRVSRDSWEAARRCDGVEGGWKIKKTLETRRPSSLSGSSLRRHFRLRYEVISIEPCTDELDRKSLGVGVHAHCTL